MSIFFTSDTHYGHKLMRELRGFSSIEEMDEKMIEAWNARVTTMDVVYHLGDLSFRPLSDTKNITKQLNGTIHLILGNHDHKRINTTDSLPHVASMSNYLEVKVDSKLLDCGKIVLCHYAFETWNKSHYGAIHCHGHSHNSLKPRGKRMDVGVDTRPDWAPWALEEILNLMKDVSIHGPDFHEDPKAKERD
jgi:calcineurin-like phosphoesterase family protein